jgi:hypothetical protein
VSRRRKFYFWFLAWGLSAAVTSIALGRNRAIEDVFGLFTFGLPAGWLCYGLFRLTVAYSDPHSRRKANETMARVTKRAIGWCARMIALGLMVGFAITLWQSHVANRTATVRAVFLHPANRNLGPQIYMNDGTVWDLSDTPENVRMIPGDKVRYVSLPNPSETMDSDSPDTCTLQDVTTGYTVQAFRLSAPFKHSSCPAR